MDDEVFGLRLERQVGDNENLGCSDVFNAAGSVWPGPEVVQMAFDTLTIAAILISLLVLALLVLVVRNSERQQRVEQQLRQVAHQSSLISSDRSAHELCQALRKLYPDACAGLDYVLARDAGKGRAFIKEWKLTAPRPTAEQIERALEAVDPEERC